MKVGDRFDVIVVIASPYERLYKAGNCGVVVDKYLNGTVSAYIGSLNNKGSFLVDKINYKKIGCLTITKLK